MEVIILDIHDFIVSLCCIYPSTMEVIVASIVVSAGLAYVGFRFAVPAIFRALVKD